MANNPYVNKVVNAETNATIIDLTADTVTASTLMQGYTAHDASGAPITGTASGGIEDGHVYQDAQGYVVLDDETGKSYQAKTNISPTTSSQTITADNGYDALSSVQINAMPSGSATTPATTVTANPSISVNSSTGLITATASATKSVTPTISAGYVSSGTAGTITVSGSNTSQLSTQAAKTVTPSESSQTAVAAGKYTTGAVTVGAISSTYVGSGITQRTSSDLTASGATVTAPAGYYASAASKSVSSMTLPTAASSTSSGTSKATIGRSTSDQYINIPTGYNSTASYYKVSAVANGTEGTPTATKGTVSNHSVSVTPSVTNTAGYISGGTKTGTAVTVSASELVSGTKSITENGTGIDVTNYASVDVAVPEGATHTGTVTGSGASSGSYVQVNGTGTQYSTNGATFSYKDGDYLKVYAGYGLVNGGYIVVDGTTVADGGANPATYNYTLPPYDIGVAITDGSKTKVEITTPSLSITSNGTYDVVDYAKAVVEVSGGGGATLLASDELTVSTTSTSVQNVQTYTLSNLSEDMIVFCVVTDKDGARNGHFYSSIGVFCTNYVSTQTRIYSKCENDGTITSGSGAYGVYFNNVSTSNISTTGSCECIVSSRYNANYTLTIDGTYLVKFYAVSFASLR